METLALKELTQQDRPEFDIVRIRVYVEIMDGSVSIEAARNLRLHESGCARGQWTKSAEATTWEGGSGDLLDALTGKQTVVCGLCLYTDGAEKAEALVTVANRRQTTGTLPGLDLGLSLAMQLELGGASDWGHWVNWLCGKDVEELRETKRQKLRWNSNGDLTLVCSENNWDGLTESGRNIVSLGDHKLVGQHLYGVIPAKHRWRLWNGESYMVNVGKNFTKEHLQLVAELYEDAWTDAVGGENRGWGVAKALTPASATAKVRAVSAQVPDKKKGRIRTWWAGQTINREYKKREETQEKELKDLLKHTVETVNLTLG